MYNPGTMMTPQQYGIFEFERRSPIWRYSGAKEAAIRERFGISQTRYYAVLDKAIDTEEAHRIDPVTARRLQRLREWRRGLRTGQHTAS